MLSPSINIPAHRPFNWSECLWYLDREFDDCIYRVYPYKVRRAFHVNGQNLLVDILFTGEALEVEWLTGEPGPGQINHIKNFIADWFDVETDLAPFYKLLGNQKELSYMPEAFAGLRFIGMPDLFEALVWAITGQQINLRFAYKIKRRMVEAYGSAIGFEGDKYWIFPPPEVIASLSVAELKDLQLSAKKAEYILNIANAFLDRTLSKQILQNLPTFEARLSLLTGIKGIGVWTANYVLMKSLNEQSAVPYGDAGLQKALVNHNIIIDKNDKEGISRFYKSVGGWESYTSLYLWRSMAGRV
ncbi:DNA-3-methyladenine glycosylase family protein [Mucilaginibacter celer]|uniref:DNA-3-methyladenine glycosylase II n=1 Tax=Mucilaginibacter celer TaxID=2305508 RepID=A0A494VUS2_9SPHI|nr:DNA-3-methyladenine glycosylase [Mucilaginibacter celer]AYL97801.1 DNA-3-methyladenine glycosylase 2 family protein [Mucilaginibacter celer]